MHITFLDSVQFVFLKVIYAGSDHNFLEMSLVVLLKKFCLGHLNFASTVIFLKVSKMATGTQEVCRLETWSTLIWIWRLFSHYSMGMEAGQMACLKRSPPQALFVASMKIMTLLCSTLVETGQPGSTSAKTNDTIYHRPVMLSPHKLGKYYSFLFVELLKIKAM